MNAPVEPVAPAVPVVPAVPAVNDNGYPDATPVAEMAAEHQAAYWKHFARKHEARANAAPDATELEALRTAAAELATRKAAELSDTERLQAEATAARAEAEAAKLEAATATAGLVRAQVAADKGLTVDQAARLHGSTKEELEADADALKALFAPAGPAAPRGPQLRHGGPAPKPATSVAEGESRYQAQHGTTT